MGWLDRLKALVGGPRKPAAAAVAPSGLFVYVKIPAAIAPVDRGRLFEDPLDKALQAAGVGEVSGGGSLLSAPDEHGGRQIKYCGIDVDLSRPEEGLALLRQKLVELKVPAGTLLQFSREGQKREEPVYQH